MPKTGIFSDKSDFENRFKEDWKVLKEYLCSYRKVHTGCRIGLVGGVWNFKHIAHERYLEKAKELVDLLVVGVDDDVFTKTRKEKYNSQRPLQPFLQRAESISHVRSVDVITKVNENFIGLLKAVRPDVLIFSRSTTDLTQEARDKYEKYVGEIVVLEAQAPPSEISTSALITSIADAALTNAKRATLSAIEEAFEKVRGDI